MNTLNLKHRRAQAGFTLIELIIVIVILGVLAATALPKFADLGADARFAKMQAASGAIKASAATFHGQWLAAGSPLDTASPAVTISQEGVPIPYASGYPTAAGMVLSAGGLSDYAFTAPSSTATVLTLNSDSSHTTCTLTYTPPTTAGSPAVVVLTASVATC